MRATFGILMAGGLLACSPVWAGNLTFDSGQTTWHSNSVRAACAAALRVACRSRNAGRRDECLDRAI